MPRLTVGLLGGFDVRIGSGPPLTLPTRKARGLLAYLAATPGRTHPRDKIATLLWGESAEEQARGSLRYTLGVLRKALDPLPGVLVADRHAIGLAADAIDTDVGQFERLARRPDTDALARAADLYRGDFLAGLAVEGQGFEEWLVRERERLREVALETLARLCASQTAAGQIEPAIRTAIRLVALDPFEEAAHRTLMRLYARQGRRAAALRQYQTCVDVIARELGGEPTTETKQVYQEILRSAAAVEAHAALPPVIALGDAPATDLVGRTAEIARLDELFRQAMAGVARVAVVGGEAGIGKSRLVAVLAQHAADRDALVLIGRCHESARVLPFAPWVEALRTANVADTTTVGALGPVWRAELSRLLPELGGPELPPSSSDLLHLFEAVARLLEQLAFRRPLVIVLEDVHWADELSLRVLAFLTRRLRSARLLVVATAREEEVADAPTLGQVLDELRGEPGFARVPLAPLTRTDAAALVHALARAGLERQTLDALEARTWAVAEGNPFVTVEAMRVLHDETPATLPPLALAEPVREMIARRLERLSATARRAASAAAVIGAEFDFDLLAQVAGLDERETAEGLEELVRRRLLHGVGEALAFVHERVRDVAYAGVLAPARTALHAAAGRVLEARHASRVEDVSDRLAHHWARADDPQQAIRYLRLFAARAARAYAFAESLAALDAALGYVERLPAEERDRADVELALAQPLVLHLVGRIQTIRDLLLARRERVERLADPALTGPYHFWLAHAASLLGDRDEAITRATQAIAAGEQAADDTTVGRACHVLSLEDFFSGRYRAGIEHGQRAVGLLADTPERWWFGHAYWTVGINAGMLGAFDLAMRAFAELDAVAEAIGDAHLATDACWGTGWIYSMQQAWPEALAATRRGVEQARDPMDGAVAQTFLGLVHVERGDGDAAVPLLDAALAQLEAFGYRPAEAVTAAFLAEACRLAGQPDRAREIAIRGRGVARAVTFRYAEAWAERVLGRIALGEGALGVADMHLARAHEIFAAIDARFEFGRAHLDLAALARARGDGDTAATHARDAHTLFVQLDVKPWIERAAALLRP